jgi:hypothetical protein
LRIRPNIFQVSGFLLTLGVLRLLPSTIAWVRVRELDIGQSFGFASLTVIIVALIVIWTGLAARNRVAWVIMAVIVWVWAFPIMMSLVVSHPRVFLDWREWVAAAWRNDFSWPRILLVNTIMFLLMLVGLILPLRALFRIEQRDEQRDRRNVP